MSKILKGQPMTPDEIQALREYHRILNLYLMVQHAGRAMLPRKSFAPATQPKRLTTDCGKKL